MRKKKKVIFRAFQKINTYFDQEAILSGEVGEVNYAVNTINGYITRGGKIGGFFLRDFQDRSAMQGKRKFILPTVKIYKKDYLDNIVLTREVGTTLHFRGTNREQYVYDSSSSFTDEFLHRRDNMVGGAGDILKGLNSSYPILHSLDVPFFGFFGCNVWMSLLNNYDTTNSDTYFTLSRYDPLFLPNTFLIPWVKNIDGVQMYGEAGFKILADIAGESYALDSFRYCNIINPWNPGYIHYYSADLAGNPSSEPSDITSLRQSMLELFRNVFYPHYPTHFIRKRNDALSDFFDVLPIFFYRQSHPLDTAYPTGVRIRGNVFPMSSGYKIKIDQVSPTQIYLRLLDSSGTVIPWDSIQGFKERYGNNVLNIRLIAADGEIVDLVAFCDFTTNGSSVVYALETVTKIPEVGFDETNKVASLLGKEYTGAIFCLAKDSQYASFCDVAKWKDRIVYLSAPYNPYITPTDMQTGNPIIQEGMNYLKMYGYGFLPRRAGVKFLDESNAENTTIKDFVSSGKVDYFLIPLTENIKREDGVYRTLLHGTPFGGQGTDDSIGADHYDFSQNIVMAYYTLINPNFKGMKTTFHRNYVSQSGIGTRAFPSIKFAIAKFDQASQDLEFGFSIENGIFDNGHYIIGFKLPIYGINSYKTVNQGQKNTIYFGGFPGYLPEGYAPRPDWGTIVDFSNQVTIPSEEIVHTLASTLEFLYAFSKNEIWAITGTPPVNAQEFMPPDLRVFKVTDQVGCLYQGAIVIENDVYFFNRTGIYILSGVNYRKLSADLDGDVDFEYAKKEGIFCKTAYDGRFVYFTVYCKRGDPTNLYLQPGLTMRTFAYDTYTKQISKILLVNGDFANYYFNSGTGIPSDSGYYFPVYFGVNDYKVSPDKQNFSAVGVYAKRDSLFFRPDDSQNEIVVDTIRRQPPLNTGNFTVKPYRLVTYESLLVDFQRRVGGEFSGSFTTGQIVPLNMYIALPYILGENPLSFKKPLKVYMTTHLFTTDSNLIYNGVDHKNSDFDIPVNLRMNNGMTRSISLFQKMALGTDSFYNVGRTPPDPFAPFGELNRIPTELKFWGNAGYSTLIDGYGMSPSVAMGGTGIQLEIGSVRQTVASVAFPYVVGSDRICCLDEVVLEYLEQELKK